MLAQGHSIRSFLRSVSMYFYMLTPFESQNTIHKLFQIGRNALLDELNKVIISKSKRTEVDENLHQFLEKVKNNLM